MLIAGAPAGRRISAGSLFARWGSHPHGEPSQWACRTANRGACLVLRQAQDEAGRLYTSNPFPSPLVGEGAPLGADEGARSSQLFCLARRTEINMTG